MKKFLIAAMIAWAILVLLFVANSYSFTGQVDLGYNTSSANNTSDTILIVDVEHTQHQISIDFDCKLHEQNNNNENDVDFLTGIQLNYKPDKLYYFADSIYHRDTANGIEDRIDLGLGAGYEFYPDNVYPRFKIQSGIYRRGGDEEQFIIKGKLDYLFHLWGPFLLREKSGVDVDMNRMKNYQIIVDTGLQVELSEQISFNVGLEYNRDNEPIPGFSKDVRKWRSTVGVRF